MNKLVKSVLLAVSISATGAYASVPDSLDYIFYQGEDAYKLKDFETARNQWTIAALRGDMYSQNGLGLLYDEGVKGIVKSEYVSRKWFILAANQGLAQAQFNLAHLYANGDPDGLYRDAKEAVYWYIKAARQGHGPAQNNLGVAYGVGKGVLKDDIRAYMWYNLATYNYYNDETGKDNRDKLAESMTPDQIDKAQDMSRICLESGYKDC